MSQTGIWTNHIWKTVCKLKVIFLKVDVAVVQTISEDKFELKAFCVQVVCPTGLCSTIQIEEKLFDKYRKLGYSTRTMFNVEAAIVEH